MIPIAEINQQPNQRHQPFSIFLAKTLRKKEEVMRYKHSTFNQQKAQFVNAHRISMKFIAMKYIDLLILKESCS